MNCFSDLNSSSKKSDGNKLGVFLIGITGSTAVILSVICAPFVSPAFRRICLPFVPATPTQIENVLSALKGRSGKFIDLGSGDGRIVLSAAKAGFQADGVELNPWLVFYSRLQASIQGQSGKTKFYRKDLWKFNLVPYKNVVIFGVDGMMESLEKKLIQEECSERRIVACRFPLPSFTPDAVIGSGVDTVWVYSNLQSKLKCFKTSAM